MSYVDDRLQELLSSRPPKVAKPPRTIVKKPHRANKDMGLPPRRVPLYGCNELLLAWLSGKAGVERTSWPALPPDSLAGMTDLEAV